jgi:uncharacterized protein YegL
MTAQPDFAQVKASPVSLICDTSGSMMSGIDPKDDKSEPRIDGLNRGLCVGNDFMKKHRLLSRSALIGLTTIDDPVQSFPYQTISEFQPPTLKTHGYTLFGQALNRACDDLAAILHRLNAEGRPYNTTTMLIMSDGAPNGETASETRDGIDRVKSLEQSKQIFVVPAGITREDCDRLDAMGFQTRAVCIAEIQWEELFRIVTASAGALAGGQRPMIV